MVKTKKFKFYSDAGHGWLAVSVKYLYILNIVDQISTCSYINGGQIYLEEDLDASIFMNAYEAKYGKEAMRIEHITDKNGRDQDYSRIRYYNNYTKFNAHLAYEKLMKKHITKPLTGYYE